ncbi:MAG: hypothetical protein D6776_01100 [Planctomycetota bacterium]|nr:MAG: hypothetical protein D6776_01100 [Planctomycetota bacterium]
MNAIDLFWIFFLLATLQPVLKRRMLDAARQSMIARIEKERGSRVILLVHRQETMSFLGFPLMRFIDIHDSEEVLRAIDMTDPEVPLDIVLHTPGGLVLAAVQIARAIKRHPGKVTVVVPHHAMSGGTLIALAADEIVMSPHAVLGPVDPQLGQLPAASLLRLRREKPVEQIDDQSLVMIDQAEKAIAQVHATVLELVAGRMADDQAEHLARTLSHGVWTHDFPITAEHARALGLHVSTELPKPFLQLMALYPQPVNQQPTVEYLPERRHAARPNP